MKQHVSLLCAGLLALAASSFAREAKLVRYPHYHNGRIAFSYLGDIWTADENGKNLQRITANPARDVYPRFSPDGKWIAFSSDRAGNLDVYIVPAEGGQVKQLTFHSADDNVLGWSPDSRMILFSSQRGEDFMAKLYVVPMEGGMEHSAGPDMGVWGTFSPDGGKLAINRRSQVYWRKYYRGAYQSDVTVMDIASRKFTDVTDFDGMDSWPMWSKDGFIYFVSDRDGGGLSNIWRASEKGGKAERVTSFKTGDVRWPAMSADGKVIVFEHDFGVWKLDVASRKTTPITLNIAAETEESMTEVRPFASKADDYDLAPNGRRVAFSIHGEVFTAPVEEGDVRQITDNPARDRDVRFSPDGKSIAFVSDRSGREEIYLVPADGSSEPRKITDLDTLKTGVRWSPDSKDLLFTTTDAKLYNVNAGSGQTSELMASKYGNITGAIWSPDGKWIAYSKPDASRTTDIYLLPSKGGEEHKVTFDSSSEMTPHFSADGKKLYFIRVEGAGGGGGGGFFGANAQAHIFSTALEHQDRDPDDPETRPDTPAEGERRGAGAQQQNQPVKDVNIDWAGLKRRTRQVTRLSSAVFNFVPAPDNRTLAFVTAEPGSMRSVPTIYTIQDDGKRLTRVTSATPSADAAGEEPPTPVAGGFGRGAISDLTFARDGRTLFFLEAGSIYSVPIQAAAPGAAATPSAGMMRGAAAAGGGSESAGATGGSARRRISYNVKVRIEKSAEWAEMFGDAWRTMKYRFYDPKMHGMDWDAARAKYQPLTEFVGDRQELLNIVNEMIGELNASHTGAAPPVGPREGAAQTRHLGIEFEPDQPAGRYKVTYIYADGPADKDWVKVKTGDYLIAIDGKPVTSNDNYWKLLNNPLNRRVTVTFNSKPMEEGSWKTRIEPVPMTVYSNLRYERWVNERKEMTKKLSGGRVGYLHIKAMDQPSLRKFEKELRENRDKEALVIDQRFNGGGNIEQELLGILVQRQYQVWQPRGTEATTRPLAGFFGPKVVLQNWRSASNAEMFPAGFKALGLGKTVGTATMGAVIGTGSYTLIDGSTVRTPGVGVYLADEKRTNMENYGVQPDIRVENAPEDNLAGRDRQLETAVAELLKELGAPAGRRLNAGLR
jgi:tricorn protease